MANRFKMRGWYGAAAVLAGLAAGFAGGWWYASSRPTGTFSLDAIPLEAVATDSNDKFILATGQVGADNEAVFFLDSISGRLQCLVMSRRIPGQFVASFTAQIFEDLQISDAKSARLLMVTGTSNFPGAGRNTRLGAAIIYVVDATSGKFVAYGVPWNSAAYNSNQPQEAILLKMAAGSIRQPDIIR